nr:hypothetical protein [Tanacetum cinerariifolium]
VPLVLNVWEPGIWLDKTEPSLIPIWVCVYNIPIEICNGNGIGKIMSGVGKPLLMDNMTKERPAKVGVLDVKYQWKPPLCTHCRTFGHSTLTCKVRPRTEEEIAAKNLKDALKIGKAAVDGGGLQNVVDNGLLLLARKTARLLLRGIWDRLKVVVRINGVESFKKSSSFGRNKGVSWMSSGKNNSSKKAPVQEIKKKSLVEKPVLASSYNQNFRPKVLDREECVLEDMEEEYNTEIWPKLKQDVVDIMESGSYPSSSIRADWSLAQINFFYQNCSKYRLDLSLEDDDVASEDGGMAAEMRSEAFSWNVKGLNNSQNRKQVIDLLHEGPWQWVSNNASRSNGTGIIVGWDPNSIRVMVISQSAQDEPWLLMGDFNVILDPSESSTGSSCFTSGMVDFRDCLGVIGVEDLVMSGLRYTWNKSPGCTNGLLKKLDRVMCNGHFMEKIVNSNAQFLPFVASDHTPAVIEIPVIFLDMQIPGHAMFLVVSKLKLLKKPLRKLKLAQGDLAKRVSDLRHELEKVQTLMVEDSFNADLRKKEMECLIAYKDALKDVESMLKQRAKVDMLTLNFFIRLLKSVFGEVKRVDSMVDISSLFTNRLSREEADYMVRPVSKDEIKGVVFSMNDDKARGPDGFSSKFFKSAWSIIGNEVCVALKEVNATIIALVPKLISPQKVSDFRPISCCNVLYKIIMKIIANRIKVNGECHGYFKGMRGLRQGNPLSPYPFTLVMEVFSLMVKRRIDEDGAFKYHWRCKRLKLTHLSFADDLMAVNAEIEQLMRGFLWSHGELRRGHAKVKWVSMYRFIDRCCKVRNFWDVPVFNDSCWGWRKLLQCREVLRMHFVHRIGDGSQTSVWFDNWLSLGPLSLFISKRDIYEAGLSLDCKVCDIVERGDFSVSNVWADLAEVKPIVSWHKLVWFSQSISHHAFMVWLAVNHRLKTLDRIAVWQENVVTKCSLCEVGSESHNHLFFECRYSLEVWQQFNDVVKLEFAPNNLFDIISYLSGRPINRSIWSILQ